MSVYEPLDGGANGMAGDVDREHAGSISGSRQRPNSDRRRQHKHQKDGHRSHTTDVESISLASSYSTRHQLHSAELSEPLTANTDPFYVFRDDLERQLERMDESLAEYLRLVHQSDSAANNSGVKAAKKHLKKCIKSAEATLVDVQTAVSLEQQKRRQLQQHPDGHLDDVESPAGSSSYLLQERQQLVETSRDRIDRAKRDSSSQSVQAKLLADERSMRRRKQQQQGNLGATSAAQLESNDMIAGSQARASLLMQHQDETLDELDVAVTRVGDLGKAIGDEIIQQNKMLDEMTTDLENAEEELGLVMGKLAKFLKTKNTWQLGTILALSGTTVVLFFLVLYT